MIRIVGGERNVRDAVRDIATDSGADVRVSGRTGDTATQPGESVIDLGLPPAEWPSGAALVEAERARAREISAPVARGTRVVRASVLAAAADAPSWWQRAAAVAEEAWRESAAESVALRVGILLGDCGLTAGFRRAVERARIVAVPGVARSKLEPLLLEDFARYCVEAASADRPLDDVYDLGCGEILTGGLLIRGLADNLGVSRWLVPVPGPLRGAVAGWFAGPSFPKVAVRHTLGALSRGLLPRRMTAWESFAVRPVDLRQSMAWAAGTKYAIRKHGKGRFGAWKPPDKKGILGTGPGARRRR